MKDKDANLIWETYSDGREQQEAEQYKRALDAAFPDNPARLSSNTPKDFYHFSKDPELGSRAWGAFLELKQMGFIESLDDGLPLMWATSEDDLREAIKGYFSTLYTYKP